MYLRLQTPRHFGYLCYFFRGGNHYQHPPFRIAATGDRIKDWSTGSSPSSQPSPVGCLARKNSQQKFQVPKIEGFLNLMGGYFGGGVGFPYIALTYGLYRWGFLHFRYQRHVWRFQSRQIFAGKKIVSDQKNDHKLIHPRKLTCPLKNELFQ